MKFVLLLATIGMTLSSYADSVMDRNLTATELNTLAPIYAQFVLQNKATVTSPAEQRELDYLGTHSTGFVRYKFDSKHNIIGIEVDPIQKRIVVIQEAIKSIESTSKEEREESIADVVSGLLDGSLTKKLTCQLGYNDESKSEFTRIVICTDDRSVAADENGEGNADIRTIILSIDAKTLLPKSVLKLTQFAAG